MPCQWMHGKNGTRCAKHRRLLRPSFISITWNRIAQRFFKTSVPVRPINNTYINIGLVASVTQDDRAIV